MKNIYLLICVLCSIALKSQTLFWAETFGIGTTCTFNQGTTANGFNSLNGTWVTATFTTTPAINDAFANIWYVSQSECGRPSGQCGARCFDSINNVNRTLHIGSAQNSPVLGTVCPTGDCGAIYDPGMMNNLVRTNTSIESPIISTVGKTGIMLQFDYILQNNPSDSLHIWAYDGGNWYDLGVPVSTPTCTGATAGAEGTWTTTFSYNLSAISPLFNNSGSVRIGFQWINNDDGIGGSPSVAIDNIELLATGVGGGTSTLDTVAVFSPDTSNHNFIYCTSTPYHFTGFANPGPILAYQWYVYPATNIVFNPPHPGLGQNGVDITFPTTGIYTITVVASSQYNGIDSSANFSALAFNTTTVMVNQTPTVTVTPPNPVFVCQGGTGTNLYANGANTYTWTQSASTTPPTPLSPTDWDSVNVNPSGLPNPVVTYTVIGTSIEGCNSAKVVVTVSVQPKPIPTYSPHDTICNGQSATLSVTNMPVNTSYHWGAAFGAGLGSSTGSPVIETPIYYNYNNSLADTLIVDTVIVHVPGCPNYAPHLMYVTVKPVPIVHVVADTVDNCNNMGAVLGATGIPTAGVTFGWSPSTGLSSVTGATVTATPTATLATYYVTPTLNGCVGLKDSVKVLKGDTTNASISAEYSIICNSQTDQLIAFPQVGYQNNYSYHYDWNPLPAGTSINGDTVIVNPTLNTVYTLTVHGTCVKHNIVTLGITVNNCTTPITGFTQSADTVCINHCIIFTDTTQLHSTKPLFYTWVFDGGIISAPFPPGISVDSSYILTYSMTNSSPLKPVRVCYKVTSLNNGPNGDPYPVIETVTNGIGQTSTYTSSVTVFPGPLANAGLDQTIDQGTSVTLSGAGSQGNGQITSYIWTQSDTGNMSCTSCIKTTVTPSVTTEYTLTVTDINGCQSVDSVIVNVDIICKDTYVANAFSPNGDGMNDVLHVKSNCEITKFSFKIFDRWGEKVFESDDPTYGWDGTFRNKPMDTAVFMYTVSGFLSSGTEVKKKGNVTLLR